MTKSEFGDCKSEVTVKEEDSTVQLNHIPNLT